MKLPANWTTNGRKGGSVTTHIITKQKKTSLSWSTMRRVGLEPTRPKAVTGSLVLRVCQFRHPRSTQELV